MGIDSEPPEAAREYIAKNGYTFPTLVDEAEKVVHQFHVESWPTTIVIDREGKVVFYGNGDKPQNLRDTLRSLGVW